MNKLKYNIGFILIIIVSIAVSVVFLYKQSIRLDEAQSIWMFSKSVPEMMHVTSQDVNLPFYGILLHFWLQILGTNIVIVRFLSLIFFILTLPVLYVMATEASNERQALLAVALFAFSPFIVWYTSEARTYTLFALITTINHLYFLRLFRSDGENGKIGFFISSFLGLYTHYFFIFLLLAQSIYIVGTAWANRKRQVMLISYFSLLVSAFFLFTPWLVYVFLQGKVVNTQPIIPAPTSYNMIQIFINFVFGFQSQRIMGFLISMWPLSLIMLFFVFTKKNYFVAKNINYFVLVSLLPVVLVFLVSFIKPIFLARYLILVTPSLFFILAWALLNYSRKVSTLLITGLLIVMFGLLLNQSVSADTPVKENYTGLTEYLNRTVQPQDIVAISSPFTIYPIEYNYYGGARLDTIPYWDRFAVGPIPPFSEQKLINQINNYKSVYNRVFVVLSYDQGYQKNIEEYLDTHFKRLELKSFSSTIQLRVYQLRY